MAQDGSATVPTVAFCIGGAMDKLAVFQCDDTVPQSQRLAIIAQFAAHGIDVAILPAGMEMVAITDGRDGADDDE